MDGIATRRGARRLCGSKGAGRAGKSNGTSVAAESEIPVYQSGPMLVIVEVNVQFVSASSSEWV
jgi:hypothetical protein